MAKVLTARGVEAVKPDSAKRLEIPDGGLPGLYLIVQPTWAKGWAVRYRFNGKPRKATLGRYPRMTLAEAREAAAEVLKSVDAGVDPAAAEKRDADTLGTLVADFLARHADKKKSGAETRRIFEREVLPLWRGREAAEISRRDVIDLLDGIVDRGAPTMANRVLSAVRKMFNWAVSRDRLSTSPAAGVKPPVAERSRERILDDDEIRAFWRATSDLGVPFGPLFRLLLLTGCRLGEVSGMRWRELDGPNWNIPGNRTKNGRAHRVHLADPALVALASVPRIKGADFVFTTNGKTAVSGYSRAKARVDAKMGEGVPPWRLHDLRRTMASGLARLGVDVVVAEKALNHISGSLAGVVGVYNRHAYEAEQRAAWQAWAAEIGRIVGEDVGGVVTLAAIRR